MDTPKTPERVDQARRRFFGAAALTVAVAQLGAASIAQAQTSRSAAAAPWRPQHTSFAPLKQVDAGLLNVASRAPVRSGSVTGAKRPQGLFVLEPSAVAREALLNRVEQGLIAEWLGQELDRAALHRLHRHRDVAMAGDEHDRYS